MENKTEDQNSRTSLWKIFFMVLGFSAFGLPMIVLARTLLFQPFNIPSLSSEPNLMLGDYLFVNKSAYGYSKYSFDPFNIFSFEGRTGHSLPEAGDIVVFKYPSDTRVDYIKRVVGLPGDHIQMINGTLNINGVATKLDYVELPQEYYDADGISFWRETLPNGRSYVVADLGQTGFDDTPEYVVPPKHYFMLGDNRDNSQDSRFLDRVGYIPEENIVGRVSFVFKNINGKSIYNRPQEVYPNN